MLNAEDCVMSNGRLIKLTPTNTPNYQIHLSKKSITPQKIHFHQIFASVSAPSAYLITSAKTKNQKPKTLQYNTDEVPTDSDDLKRVSLGNYQISRIPLCTQYVLPRKLISFFVLKQRKFFVYFNQQAKPGVSLQK